MKVSTVNFLLQSLRKSRGKETQIVFLVIASEMGYKISFWLFTTSFFPVTQTNMADIPQVSIFLQFTHN